MNQDSIEQVVMGLYIQECKHFPQDKGIVV